MKYPILHEGDPTSGLVQDVAQLLAAHGYPTPDVDDLPRLAQALSMFLHGDMGRAAAVGRVIQIVEDRNVGRGTASAPYAGHVLFTGGTADDTTAALTDVAHRHFADGGTLWLHVHDGVDTVRWTRTVPIYDWITVADTLPEQITHMRKLCDFRAGAEGEALEAYPCVLLVIDDLRGLLDNPATVTDLVSVLRHGSRANVWVAAATEHVDLLPAPLAEAFKTYASVTDVKDIPS